MFTLAVELVTENYDRLISLIDQDDRSENLKKMYEDLGDEVATAPASSTKHHHNAFPGGYLDHVLRVHTMAIQVAKLWSENEGPLNFTPQELSFAALHHDLGKVGEPGNPYYVDQDSDWHRKNLGKMYKFNDGMAYMTVPDRALFMLQKYGVTVTRNEWLAIQLADGIYDEGNKAYLKSNMHQYPFETNLPHIIHTADYLATHIEKEKSKF